MWWEVGGPWFAWRPVRADTGWRWLTVVVRIVSGRGPDAARVSYKAMN